MKNKDATKLQTDIGMKKITNNYTENCLYNFQPILTFF